MSAYSFKDVKAALSGPGGMVSFGGDSAAAKEGFTVEPTGDKSVMLIGGGGDGMHSLLGDESGTVTINLLRSSPANAVLQVMYNLQTTSARRHGKNTIAFTDLASGEVGGAHQAAFAKRASRPYATEGGIISWVFHAIKIDGFIGVYDK